MARSRVELFEQIRRDRRVEKLSIRELADKHHVHRRTVREALASAIPAPRKAYPRRRRPAIDGYVEIIDDWLVTDQEVPRKQRHTARRVWQRLVAEHGATLAEVTVSRFHDLGPDFYDTRLGAQRATRNHIRALQALGYNVTLQPAA